MTDQRKSLLLRSVSSNTSPAQSSMLVNESDPYRSLNDLDEIQ